MSSKAQRSRPPARDANEMVGLAELMLGIRGYRFVMLFDEQHELVWGALAKGERRFRHAWRCGEKVRDDELARGRKVKLRLVDGRRQG